MTSPRGSRPLLRGLLWGLLAGAIATLLGAAVLERRRPTLPPPTHPASQDTAETPRSPATSRILAVSTGGAESSGSAGSGSAPAAGAPALGGVPEFALTNRDGRTVRLGDLKGAPWIADFIFTRCPTSCPLLSERMARLDRRLPPEVRLVSISVDPAFDSSAVLARYAAKLSASPRWLFLSGDPAEVQRLSRDGFRLGMSRGGPDLRSIVHSSRFVLVDARGDIRKLYDALDAASLGEIQVDLAALAREPSPAGEPRPTR